MEEKKNNKGIIWLITILIVLIIGLAGYIVYDKIIDDNNTNNIDNNKTTEKQEDRKNITEKAENILSKLDIYSLLNKDKIDFKDMDNETKLWIMYRNYNLLTEKENFQDVTSDELLEGMKSIFGNDFNMTFDDVYVYKYNKETKKYEDEYGGYGFGITTAVKNDMISYEQNGEYYYITYKPMLYDQIEGCETSIKFTDVKKTNVYNESLTNENVICSVEDIDVKTIDNAYNSSKAKLIDVKFKFKLENGILKLVGYELSNNKTIKSITYNKYDEQTEEYSTYEIKNDVYIQTINRIIRNSIPGDTTTGVGLDDTIIFNYNDGTTERIIFMGEKSFVTEKSNIIYYTENNENLKEILSEYIK